MKHDIYSRALVLLAVIFVAATVLGACSDSEPEDVAFEFAIADRALDLDPPVLKVKQGDEVTLTVRSDEEGEIHLHGYDLDISVVPGTVGELVFTANATGAFDMTFHGKGNGLHEDGPEDEEETSLGSLEVHPR